MRLHETSFWMIDQVGMTCIFLTRDGPWFGDKGGSKDDLDETKETHFAWLDSCNVTSETEKHYVLKL